MTSRPASITVVAVLLGVAAASYVVGAIVSIYLWSQPLEAQMYFGHSIEDGFWILCSLLFIVLALVLVFVLRSALIGEPGSGVAVSLLCLLGVGFSLFAITEGSGWIVLVLSLVTLIANQTSSAQAWYRSHAQRQAYAQT